MHIFQRLLALAIFYMALSGPAYAYLDPVTGSLIVQGIIALVAGIVAGVKTIRQKILGFFRGLFKRNPT